MNDWIAAGIAVAAGVVIGMVAARIVAKLLGNETRPNVIRASAGPAASLVFSIGLIGGLTTALGFVNTAARDQIPKDLVDYLPSVLSAGIVMIGANVLAQLVSAALERTTARLPGSAARNIPNIVRIAIMAFGGILAAAQLGVDTTIINIAVASLLFSIGLGAALMVGLGSRRVSGEIAAGRAIRRVLSPGDHVTIGDVAGTVIDVSPVSLEIDTGDEGSVLVPHSHLLDSQIRVRRTDR